jgi:hypothetical protein
VDLKVFLPTIILGLPSLPSHTSASFLPLREYQTYLGYDLLGELVLMIMEAENPNIRQYLFLLFNNSTF